VKGIRLSLTIMFAGWEPSRRAMVSNLVRRLGGRSLIEEKTVRFSLVEDKNRDGLYRTAKRAWFDHVKAPSPTHHLVLQEDMTPCAGFLDGALDAIRARPEDVICFWYGDKRSDAMRGGDPLWVADTVSHGGSTVVPVDLIFPWWKWSDRYRAWRDALGKKEFYCEDALRDLWGVTKGRKTWHPLPSMLQHGVPGVETSAELDHGSLLGHGYRASRHSRWYIGDAPTAIPDWEKAKSNSVWSTWPATCLTRLAKIWN
jgi:hypothetical protein